METNKPTNAKKLIVVLILVTLLAIFFANVYDDYKDNKNQRQQKLDNEINTFLESLSAEGNSNIYNEFTGTTREIYFQNINKRFENYTIYEIDFKLKSNTTSKPEEDCNSLEVYNLKTGSYYQNIRKPICTNQSDNFLVALPNNESITLDQISYSYVIVLEFLSKGITCLNESDCINNTNQTIKFNFPEITNQSNTTFYVYYNKED